MKYSVRHNLLAISIAALLPLSTIAAPNTISYNGKLLGKDGVTLKGTQIVEFSLCDQIMGGTCNWKEQQSVNFSNGSFSVQLGSVTPLPSSIFENKGLYLGVSLFISTNNWETFAPRQTLTAAPFAMNANDVLQKDISPRSVSINGVGLVIDSTGKWVGSSAGLQGAPGAPALTSLISLTDEPAGTNCVNAGKKISVGLDKNGNNILEASEVSSTAFVCNGVNGTSVTSTTPGGQAGDHRSTLTHDWTQAFGGFNSDDVKGLALDATGNLYVIGSYTSTFDGLQEFGGVDIFVKKYSPTGSALWTKGFGNSGNDRVTAIAVDPTSGGIYIGGSFNGLISTDFDPDPLKQTMVGSSSGNSIQPFILHLDQNGVFVWVKTFSSLTNQGEGGISDLVLDENQNIYYSGTYGSTKISPPVSINFNTDQYGNDVKSTLGRADFFVSKLDKNGYYQWTYLAGQKSNYMAAARIKAKGGIVYVVGKDKTYNSILLTKLNSGTGTKTGETSWSSTNFPYLAPTGIAIDSTGGIAVSAVGSIFKFGTNGNKLSDYFLLRSLISGRSIFPSIPESFTIIQKFDSTLSPVWTYTQGLFGNNGPFAIAFDVNNNIYFGGEYMGDLVYSVYDSRGSVGGSTDVNLVKLNSLGQFQWAETIGGYGRDRLQSIVVDGNNIFIGGFFSGGMDGNITHSPRQYISSHGAEDGFVGKYSGITAP